MSDTYSRLWVHLVWSTWRRSATITEDIELIVHDALRHEVVRSGGRVIAIGGTHDHVHVVLWLHPGCSVANLVRRMKVSSARAAPDRAERTLRWQRGYAAFSLQTRALGRVAAYVNNQRAHHHVGELLDALERTERPLHRP